MLEQAQRLRRARRIKYVAITPARFLDEALNINETYWGMASTTAAYTSSAAVTATFDAEVVAPLGLEAGVLFHFDGVDGATTTLDTSGNAHTITLTGATIDTSPTRKKFGTASLLIGSSGTWYELDGSADLAFGTGDFTIDFWLVLASTSGSRNFYDSRPVGNPAGNYPLIRHVSGTGLQFLVGSTVVITGAILVFNTQYHIAVTRASGSTRLFINGVQSGSTYTDSNNYIVGANRPTCAAFNGSIDELRVVKGRAEWTANFTPPTVPWVGLDD